MGSILIVGVGGQGTLLASRIIGNLMLSLGNDVKMSEVHGMAQRGGSVVTHVKYGQEVSSPLVEKGCADYILAFENLEALRAVHFLGDNGKMIINAQEILPMPVIVGACEYPTKNLKDDNRVMYIDAQKEAIELGNIKTVNVILIGLLAKQMNIATKEQWIEILKKTVKPKFVELNIKAFDIGYNL